MHTHTHTHTHTYMHTHAHTYTHIHAHTRTRAHIYTHIHAQARAHAHTRTHKHTHFSCLCASCVCVCVCVCVAVMVEVFDWGRYLGDGDVIGAPVSCFKHVGVSQRHTHMRTCCVNEVVYMSVVVVQVQMWRSWGDISEGVRVEVPNTDCVLPMKVYWIAGIIKLAGTQESKHLHLHLVTFI